MKEVNRWAVILKKKFGFVRFITNVPDEVTRAMEDFLLKSVAKIKNDMGLKKEMEAKIESFEYVATGKKMLNGGFADANITKIQDKGDYYKVTSDITIGDCFEGPKSETYYECEYFFEKEGLRLSSKKDPEHGS